MPHFLLAVHSGSGAMESDPLAGATSSAASTASNPLLASLGGGAGRERDLPPFFDGSDPTLYKRYFEKAIYAEHRKAKEGLQSRICDSYGCCIQGVG